jgi:hypothetical protein
MKLLGEPTDVNIYEYGNEQTPVRNPIDDDVPGNHSSATPRFPGENRCSVIRVRERWEHRLPNDPVIRSTKNKTD